MRPRLVIWKHGCVKGFVPENDDEPWNHVTIVNRNSDTGNANVNANWRSNTNSDNSVPSFEDCLSKRRSVNSTLLLLKIMIWTLSILQAFSQIQQEETPS